MPGVCPEGGGGMLKFRFDRRISDKLMRLCMLLALMLGSLVKTRLFYDDGWLSLFKDISI